MEPNSRRVFPMHDARQVISSLVRLFVLDLDEDAITRENAWPRREVRRLIAVGVENDLRAFGRCRRDVDGAIGRTELLTRLCLRARSALALGGVGAALRRCEAGNRRRRLARSALDATALDDLRGMPLVPPLAIRAAVGRAELAPLRRPETQAGHGAPAWRGVLRHVPRAVPTVDDAVSGLQRLDERRCVLERVAGAP